MIVLDAPDAKLNWGAKIVCVKRRTPEEEWGYRSMGQGRTDLEVHIWT